MCTYLGEGGRVQSSVGSRGKVLMLTAPSSEATKVRMAVPLTDPTGGAPNPNGVVAEKTVFDKSYWEVREAADMFEAKTMQQETVATTPSERSTCTSLSACSGESSPEPPSATSSNQVGLGPASSPRS